MISTALPLLSLVALSAAQSSTVSLFLLIADPQSLVASIAGSDSTATTYVVGCPSETAGATATAASASATDFLDSDNFDAADCGFQSSITVVQGPSTVHFALSISDAVESVNCKLMGTTQADCTLSASGDFLISNSIPALTTTTATGTDVSFLPVVVTAGSANAKETGSSSAKTTGSSSASSPKSTGSSSGSTPMSTGSSTGGAQTGSSSSAAAQATNAALQGTPALGAGIIGALGVAVAGAIL